jgi:hypothetical protein
MGIILEFRRSEEAARMTMPAEGSLGEIIIFPGVRIDRRAPGDTPRLTDTPSPRRRAQRSRKK